MIRSAIIGYGGIGKVHEKVIPHYGELVAVCDIREERLEKFGDLRTYTDYRKMLDEVSPDVVHICTPHYLHAEMVIEALSRDINVLCEKPLCIRKEDIGRILEAEKRSKGKLGVCHQNRYNAANRFVKEYLKDKTVEAVNASVTWHRDETYYAADAWRGKWDTEGGGVLINQALHTLDLLQWFMGTPDTVTASVSNLTLKNKIEVEDTATILCHGKAGGVFYATNGGNRDYPVELTIRADGEWIKIMPKYVVVGEEIHSFKTTEHTYGKACYGSGHECLIADFYDCVETGRSFPISGEEGAKVVRLILAAYKSGGAPISMEEEYG